MNLILFDSWCRLHLLPLTHTRPAADIRVGILTIREKWERRFQKTSTLTKDYLQEKFPLCSGDDNLLIAGALLPNPQLVEAITKLQPEEALYDENNLLAFRTSDAENLRNFFDGYLTHPTSALPMKQVPYNGQYDMVVRPYHIFMYNGEEIENDFALLTEGRASQPLSSTNVVIGDRSRIFIEEGASVECSTLNTREGCIYIGRNAEVMEGCHLRGPIALCDNAVAKMGAKFYGATTLGPYSKAGGELGNVIFFGYSNKAHDGYLGNAVIGEWCNLGAGTNCSNLKNNYSTVRLWNGATRKMEDTGLQFCGLIMGDHSKCGISTTFNTGTVIGVGCGLFGTGLHPKFVPSFSFGTPSLTYATHDLIKLFETTRVVMARRHKDFDAVEQTLLKRVYEITSYSEN